MQQYLELLKDIRKNGVYRLDRTGTGCYSLVGRQMRFNLSDDQFPLLTTKKVHLKSIIHELIWFLSGDTNIRYLNENNVKIWDNWANEFGDLGTIYSAPWRRLPLSGADTVLIKRRRGPEPGPLVVKTTSEELLESVYSGDLRVNHDNAGDPFRIIKDLGTCGGRNTMYLVQFDRTLSTRLVSRPNIRSGTKIIDNDMPDIFEVACIGSISKFREREYNLWFNMIARCYNKNNPQYRSYGGAGVYVSPRWLCFANFLSDLSKIPLYEQWCRVGREYELDKDYYGAKCYDVSTCIFLKKEFNHELAVGEQTIATHEDGRVEMFVTRKQLSRFFNVSEETVSNYQACKYGASKLDGWKISKADSSGDYLVRRKLIQDQIQELVEGLKTNPFSRRHIVTGWLPELLPNENMSFSDNISKGKQALPPCHTLFQFFVTPLELIERQKLAVNSGHNPTTWAGFQEFEVSDILDSLGVSSCKLSCQLYQRSADVFLGVPFNIASYALLTKMMSKVTNMAPGEFIWVGGDVHLYSNHLEQVDLQLTRTPHQSPIMVIKDRSQSINDFMYEDFELKGYICHNQIPAPISV